MKSLKLVGEFVKFTAIFGLGMLYFAVGNAHANATSDAQQALNKAYNDYYTALRTGPAKSPAEQARLRSQIVSPAESALNKAMAQDAAAFDPNKAARAINPGSGAGGGSRSNSGAATLGNQGGFRGGNDPGNAAPPANTSSVDTTPIEGSAPKEIQFPGPLSLPKAAPSPTKSQRR